MNTLRAKVTVLLVGAVLLVAVLATFLSFFILSPPRFETAEEALAAQWLLLADLVGQSDVPLADQAPYLGVRDVEPTGRLLEGPTQGINAALVRKARVERVSVRMTGGTPLPVISGQLTDGRWLLMPMTMLPEPRDPAWAFFGWLLVMAAGTTLVMVIAVRRLTEPLALLERTVEAIGPDGELAPLPESGPAEIRAAARAINLLSQQLKRAMESRVRIVAAAGHDLRTPMTRMRLRAEFLDEEERGTWIADLDELDRIADSAIRLVREEVDGSPRQSLRLDTLVREIVEELAGIGLDVRLGTVEPASVVARPLSLRRAVRNVAINAATHGREAQITVSTSEDQAVVQVDDRGPGIPEALMSRVFEPFFRVDPARGAPIPGAGLGLAIAREIVIGNGGTLELGNRSEGGLMQRLRFPLAGPAVGE